MDHDVLDLGAGRKLAYRRTDGRRPGHRVSRRAALGHDRHEGRVPRRPCPESRPRLPAVRLYRARGVIGQLRGGLHRRLAPGCHGCARPSDGWPPDSGRVEHGRMDRASARKTSAGPHRGICGDRGGPGLHRGFHVGGLRRGDARDAGTRREGRAAFGLFRRSLRHHAAADRGWSPEPRIAQPAGPSVSRAAAPRIRRCGCPGSGCVAVARSRDLSGPASHRGQVRRPPLQWSTGIGDAGIDTRRDRRNILISWKFPGFRMSGSPRRIDRARSGTRFEPGRPGQAGRAVTLWGRFRPARKGARFLP